MLKIRMRGSKLTATIAILCLVFSCQPLRVVSQTQSNTTNRTNYKFVNGQWFDGKRFQRQTYYSADGILSKKKPRGEFEAIDLANGFVIPPLAEAHNHNVGS